MQTILIANTTAEFRTVLDETLAKHPNVRVLNLSPTVANTLMHSKGISQEEVDQNIIQAHLMALNLPQSRKGFQQLCIAISMYAKDPNQLLTKEIYPAIAGSYAHSSVQVEHTIRTVIKDAWRTRNKRIWEHYFPERRSAPTNKQFISTLAQLLK